MDLISFYKSHSPYTFQGKYSNLFPSKIDSYNDVFKFIKYLIIHPVSAKQIGIKANYKEVMRQHVFHRSILDLCNNNKIAPLLENYRKKEESEPFERELLSCDHASLIFTSILRCNGIPVRMRVVFANYIIPKKLIPHWIVEVFDEKSQKWSFIDPDLQINPLLDTGFSLPGKIWLDSRFGSFDCSGINLDNKNGYDVVKYELINDANCILKNELVNYDWMITRSGQKTPLIVRNSFGNLSDENLEFLDTLASYLINPNEKIDKIISLYSTYIKKENLRSQLYN